MAFFWSQSKVEWCWVFLLGGSMTPMAFDLNGRVFQEERTRVVELLEATPSSEVNRSAQETGWAERSISSGARGRDPKELPDEVHFNVLKEGPSSRWVLAYTIYFIRPTETENPYARVKTSGAVLDYDFIKWFKMPPTRSESRHKWWIRRRANTASDHCKTPIQLH